MTNRPQHPACHSFTSVLQHLAPSVKGTVLRMNGNLYTQISLGDVPLLVVADRSHDYLFVAHSVHARCCSTLARPAVKSMMRRMGIPFAWERSVFVLQASLLLVSEWLMM
jgi:hypothetical protein